MSEPSEILTAVQKTFISEFDKSEKLTALYKKVDDGTATFKEVEELSGEIGDMLSNAYASNIGEEVEVTSEMAEAVLKPTLKNNYDLVTDACTKTQDNLNQQAGLSMKAVVPGADQNRIQGIIDKAVDDRLIDYGQMMRTLKKNTTNYSMSVADTFIEKNADYQYQSGLRPTIKRTLNGIKPCPFCIARAGSYTYPLKDHEVYRRHANCYCTVEYTPVGSKTSQNIWDKKWRTQEETEKQQRLQTARSIENIEASQKHIGRDLRITSIGKSRGEDVTAEYRINATPGEGSISYSNHKAYNTKEHANEIRMAEWVHDNLGGDIKLLSEENRNNVKTPDYCWNEKSWELKTIKSIKASDSALRKGMKQIEKNPGGIILDCTENAHLCDELEYNINDRMNRHDIKADILVIQNGRLEKAIRYN